MKQFSPRRLLPAAISPPPPPVLKGYFLHTGLLPGALNSLLFLVYFGAYLCEYHPDQLSSHPLTRRSSYIMSESRPNLTSSLSFAGASTASAISRPLKRRLTTTPDLGFFTPAAQSFKPRPYTPNAVPVSSSKPLIPTTRPHSSLTSLAQPIPVMDPSSLDPHAFFLHPPFTAFPDSHNHPEGLSYALMSLNPEWFLDATDFVSTTPNTDGHHAVPYPPQLEPPRGWCPAKKKDLKALGAEGWPEGEEPRLRCTFCRRTYAGVNAKSMWRRHVYEKHKIAMANRREGNDRGRVGRGSNSMYISFSSNFQN